MGVRRILRMLGLLALAAVLLGSAGVGRAQEHPEHPSEHPTSTKAISKESLAAAIADYVQHEAKLKGGYFLIYDAKAGKPLALTLVKVHKQRLARTAEDTYFACADFKSTDGHMYDLDIFMKGRSPDKLKVTEITVHKVDGKPRYKWVQEGGLWKRK